MPDRWLHDFPHIRHPAQEFFVRLRRCRPRCRAAHRATGGVLPLRASIADASAPVGAAHCVCKKQGQKEGWLAVPFTVSRRSHRQGLRVLCTLAASRPSVEP